MSFAIDLAPDIQRRLRDEAARLGVDAQDHARILVEDGLAPAAAPQPSLWETATPEDRIRGFDEWLDSLATKTPPLPTEALRRESIYDDRGL